MSAKQDVNEVPRHISPDQSSHPLHGDTQGKKLEWEFLTCCISLRNEEKTKIHSDQH